MPGGALALTSKLLAYCFVSVLRFLIILIFLPIYCDCPIQISDEEKQEILAALRGEVAIPVYATEEGVKRYSICSLAQFYVN